MAKKKSSSFGSKLKGFRERAGLTLEQLAQKAGMHKFGIAKLERGEREPSWASVQAIADALGIPLEDFKNGDVEEEQPPAPKPKGRPRKAPAVAQDGRSSSKAS